MCGRYVIAYDPQTLVSGFSLTRIQPFDRRFNIAPQSAVPVVYETKEGERVAELMRWGLVPHWAKDLSIGAKLNNDLGTLLVQLGDSTFQTVTGVQHSANRLEATPQLRLVLTNLPLNGRRNGAQPGFNVAGCRIVDMANAGGDRFEETAHDDKLLGRNQRQRAKVSP